MTLDEARAHVGDGVVYRPDPGSVEDGVISGVNETMVFVRYRGDTMAKATRAEDLVLMARETW